MKDTLRVGAFAERGGDAMPNLIEEGARLAGTSPEIVADATLQLAVGAQAVSEEPASSGARLAKDNDLKFLEMLENDYVAAASDKGYGEVNQMAYGIWLELLAHVPPAEAIGRLIDINQHDFFASFQDDDNAQRLKEICEIWTRGGNGANLESAELFIRCLLLASDYYYNQAGQRVSAEIDKKNYRSASIFAETALQMTGQIQVDETLARRAVMRTSAAYRHLKRFDDALRILTPFVSTPSAHHSVLNEMGYVLLEKAREAVNQMRVSYSRGPSFLLLGDKDKIVSILNDAQIYFKRITRKYTMNLGTDKTTRLAGVSRAYSGIAKSQEFLSAVYLLIQEKSDEGRAHYDEDAFFKAASAVTNSIEALNVRDADPDAIAHSTRVFIDNLGQFERAVQYLNERPISLITVPHVTRTLNAITTSLSDRSLPVSDQLRNKITEVNPAVIQLSKHMDIYQFLIAQTAAFIKSQALEDFYYTAEQLAEFKEIVRSHVSEAIQANDSIRDKDQTALDFDHVYELFNVSILDVMLIRLHQSSKEKPTVSKLTEEVEKERLEESGKPGSVLINPVLASAVAARFKSRVYHELLELTLASSAEKDNGNKNVNSNTKENRSTPIYTKREILDLIRADEKRFQEISDLYQRVREWVGGPKQQRLDNLHDIIQKSIKEFGDTALTITAKGYGGGNPGAELRRLTMLRDGNKNSPGYLNEMKTLEVKLRDEAKGVPIIIRAGLEEVRGMRDQLAATSQEYGLTGLAAPLEAIAMIEAGLMDQILNPQSPEYLSNDLYGRLMSHAREIHRDVSQRVDANKILLRESRDLILEAKEKIQILKSLGELPSALESKMDAEFAAIEKAYNRYSLEANFSKKSRAFRRRLSQLTRLVRAMETRHSYQEKLNQFQAMQKNVQVLEGRISTPVDSLVQKALKKLSDVEKRLKKMPEYPLFYHRLPAYEKSVKNVQGFLSGKFRAIQADQEALVIEKRQWIIDQITQVEAVLAQLKDWLYNDIYPETDMRPRKIQSYFDSLENEIKRIRGRLESGEAGADGRTRLTEIFSEMRLNFETSLKSYMVKLTKQIEPFIAKKLTNTRDLADHKKPGINPLFSTVYSFTHEILVSLLGYPQYFGICLSAIEHKRLPVSLVDELIDLIRIDNSPNKPFDEHLFYRWERYKNYDFPLSFEDMLNVLEKVLYFYQDLYNDKEGALPLAYARYVFEAANTANLSAREQAPEEKEWLETNAIKSLEALTKNFWNMPKPIGEGEKQVLSDYFHNLRTSGARLAGVASDREKLLEVDSVHNVVKHLLLSLKMIETSQNGNFFVKSNNPTHLKLAWKTVRQKFKKVQSENDRRKITADLVDVWYALEQVSLLKNTTFSDGVEDLIKGHLEEVLKEYTILLLILLAHGMSEDIDKVMTFIDQTSNDELFSKLSRLRELIKDFEIKVMNSTNVITLPNISELAEAIISEIPITSVKKDHFKVRNLLTRIDEYSIFLERIALQQFGARLAGGTSGIKKPSSGTRLASEVVAHDRLFVFTPIGGQFTLHSKRYGDITVSVEQSDRSNGSWLALNIRPSQGWIQKNPNHSRYLFAPKRNKYRMDEKMPPEGTFGQIIVRANYLDLPGSAPPVPVLHLEQIQCRRGYGDIPRKFRHDLDLWRDESIKMLADIAAANEWLLYGDSAVMVPWNDRTKKENYTLPYQRLGWADPVFTKLRLFGPGFLWASPHNADIIRNAQKTGNLFRLNKKLRGFLGFQNGHSVKLTLNNNDEIHYFYGGDAADIQRFINNINALIRHEGFSSGNFQWNIEGSGSDAILSITPVEKPYSGARLARQQNREQFENILKKLEEGGEVAMSHEAKADVLDILVTSPELFNKKAILNLIRIVTHPMIRDLVVEALKQYAGVPGFERKFERFQFYSDDLVHSESIQSAVRGYLREVMAAKYLAELHLKATNGQATVYDVMRFEGPSESDLLGRMDETLFIAEVKDALPPELSNKWRNLLFKQHQVERYYRAVAVRRQDGSNAPDKVLFLIHFNDAQAMAAGANKTETETKKRAEEVFYDTVSRILHKRAHLDEVSADAAAKKYFKLIIFDDPPILNLTNDPRWQKRPSIMREPVFQTHLNKLYRMNQSRPNGRLTGLKKVQREADEWLRAFKQQTNNLARRALIYYFGGNPNHMGAPRLALQKAFAVDPKAALDGVIKGWLASRNTSSGARLSTVDQNRFEVSEDVRAALARFGVDADEKGLARVSYTNSIPEWAMSAYRPAITKPGVKPVLEISDISETQLLYRDNLPSLRPIQDIKIGRAEVYLSIARINGQEQPVVYKKFTQKTSTERREDELIAAQILDRMGKGAPFYGVVKGEANKVDGYVIGFIAGTVVGSTVEYDTQFFMEMAEIGYNTIPSESIRMPNGKLAPIDAGDFVRKTGAYDPELLAEYIRDSRAGARLVSQGMRDHSGVGFSSGKLTSQENRYFYFLQEQFKLSNLTVDEKRDLINALVRIGEGALRLRPEIFNTEAFIQNILQRKAFEMAPLLQRITAEKRRYQNKVDKNGRRLFRDSTIHALLFRRLIPFSWTEILRKEGLGTSESVHLLTRRSNPIKIWRQNLRPIKNRLVRDGVSNTDAIRLVTHWFDPKGMWNFFKPIRKGLIENQNLTEAQATRMVFTWAHSEARVDAIQRTEKNLEGKTGLNPAKLRLYLIENSYETIRERLTNPPYNLSEDLLAPLKAYENKYHVSQPSGARLANRQSASDVLAEMTPREILNILSRYSDRTNNRLQVIPEADETPEYYEIVRLFLEKQIKLELLYGDFVVNRNTGEAVVILGGSTAGKSYLVSSLIGLTPEFKKDPGSPWEYGHSDFLQLLVYNGNFYVMADPTHQRYFSFRDRDGNHIQHRVDLYKAADGLPIIAPVRKVLILEPEGLSYFGNDSKLEWTSMIERIKFTRDQQLKTFDDIKARLNKEFGVTGARLAESDSRAGYQEALKAGAGQKIDELRKLLAGALFNLRTAPDSRDTHEITDYWKGQASGYRFLISKDHDAQLTEEALIGEYTGYFNENKNLFLALKELESLRSHGEIFGYGVTGSFSRGHYSQTSRNLDLAILPKVPTDIGKLNRTVAGMNKRFEPDIHMMLEVSGPTYRFDETLGELNPGLKSRIHADTYQGDRFISLYGVNVTPVFMAKLQATLKTAGPLTLDQIDRDFGTHYQLEHVESLPGARLASQQAKTEDEITPDTALLLAGVLNENPSLAGDGNYYAFLNRGGHKNDTTVLARFRTNGADIFYRENEVMVPVAQFEFEAAIQTETPEVLQARSDEIRSERLAAQIYKKGDYDGSKAVVLPFITDVPLSKEEREVYQGKIDSLRNIVGANVGISFIAKMDGQYKVYDATGELPKDRNAYAAAYLGVASADALRQAASDDHAGFFGMESREEGKVSVLHFVADSVLAVMVARSDGLDENINQLWNELKTLESQSLDPHNFKLVKSVQTPDPELYTGLKLRVVAKIAWDKFLDYARMARKYTSSAA